MTFKNQKEEVIEIELTSYGKHLLSKGKFRPTFYAFFDDDILYDAEYAGAEEEQNYAQTRILEETPRLRVQTTYTGLETEIEKQIEEARANNKKLKDSFQSTKERHYALSAPLGRSSLDSDFAPSWDITLHGANFEQQIIILNDGGNDEDGSTGRILPIPQMNLESLEFKVAVVDGALLSNDLGSQSVSHITDHAEEPAGLQEYYENGNVIKVDHKDIIIEVDELHTESLSENYDIELFLVEEETIANNLVETLVPLSFIKEAGSNIINGLYVEEQEEIEPVDIDETYIENYLDVFIDEDINPDDLCRLGYRTDFTKRGHIRVSCTDGKTDSRMNEIYNQIDEVPPFGDDC